MKKWFLMLLIPLVFAALPSGKRPAIYLIGDSTMSDKKDPQNNPERGWGQLLPRYFSDAVVIDNHARNGRSSKSFITEGLWQAVVDTLQPHDYVFIQFAHNDEKDYDSTRFTNPFTGYRRNLERFVRETRAKGATPVLLTPIVRRHFNDKGVLVDTHGLYPLVVRMVAKDLDVPFIDLQLLTEDMVLTAGIEASKEYYMWVAPGEYELFPEGVQDNTHLTEKGATEVAGLVCSELKRMEIAVSHFLLD